jgi:two-component system, chemotaxis family, sensor kinase CheA
MQEFFILQKDNGSIFMTDKDFKEHLSDIVTLLEKFEKGDLFTLFEIKEGMQEITGKIPDKIIKLSKNNIDIIKGFFSVDVDMEYIDDYIDGAYSFAKSLKSFSSGKIKENEFIESINEVSGKISGFVDKNIIKNTKNIYPDGYFDNIVEDEDMLMKFCDELREHMDESQITLIDLEFDNTNEENINKVFRAFHTAKSSSAFLGFKNIEEVAHKMEDMLALVRDGKLLITKELIDVIFYGINFFREFICIIENEKYEKNRIIESFKSINIYTYISVIKSILDNYNVKKIGEILLEEGKLDKELIEVILKKQNADSGKKFGEIAVEENIISESDLKSAMKKQAVNTNNSKNAVFVKVSNQKLNELIDLVGELVINQSMMRQNKDGESGSDLNTEDSSYSQLEKITTSIKNIVLSMGMVPVSEIFNKLRVVVRNASNELSKTVNVEIEGESTELDRNVIETIYDPLVHIVRNAVDHGLEPSEERVKAGKSKVGKIKIEAIHKGNNIEIKITDDGKGIEGKDRVLEKAIEKGLVSREDSVRLEDKDIYNFMFLPGFSTARQVTELSGRGVGLDVVKRNIEQIHGKIEIRSVIGKYSQFVIKLPLTLAIIDGFVTIINAVKYIFPFNIIEEIIIPDSTTITKMENGQLMLYLRKAYIPVIFAGKTLNEEKYNTDLENILIIIINHQNKFYGIAVDSIAGKQEIVIKNLNQALNNLKIFSGGTIFGDGTIGFVVDIEEFMEKSKDYIDQ